MNTDSPRQRCRWFVRRLPLLAGGELVGADRRKVERHLITCPDCRRRQAATAGALGVLHAAAAEPAVVEFPSLWPALQRQIREERHAPRPARSAPLRGLGPWFDTLAAWFQFRPRPRAVALLALTVVVTGAVAWGVEFWAQRRVTAILQAARQPIVPSLDVDLLRTPSALDPAPGSIVAWEAGPSPPVAAEPSRPAQLDYDLDTGTPMGPDARERGAKASY
jgi:anti-sigma factor RsiW